MIAVDTNVLVRILVDDPGAAPQMQSARALLEKSEALYVPQIVQVETVWVLESAYGFDKTAICKIHTIRPLILCGDVSAQANKGDNRCGCRPSLLLNSYPEERLDGAS